MKSPGRRDRMLAEGVKMLRSACTGEGAAYTYRGNGYNDNSTGLNNHIISKNN